jgi:hypothetical protein
LLRRSSGYVIRIDVRRIRIRGNVYRLSGLLLQCTRPLARYKLDISTNRGYSAHLEIAMLLEVALMCNSGLLQYTAFLGPAMCLEKVWWDSIARKYNIACLDSDFLGPAAGLEKGWWNSTARKYNIVSLDSDFLGPVVRPQMAWWDSTARKYNIVFLDSDYLVAESSDCRRHLHFHSNTDCRDW